MGVSIHYEGDLAKGKTVNSLVRCVEKLARENGYRTERAKGKYFYTISRDAIEKPGRIDWAMSAEQRVRRFCEVAEIDPMPNDTHQDLCRRLMSTTVKQTGVYLWTYDRAEPLRFLFRKGGTKLEEFQQNRVDEYEFVILIDSMSTNTGYTDGPEGVANHELQLSILKDINIKYFDGKMRIEDPE
ncbi:hypothetical protein HN814_08230 [Candidatus Woesearchaeota archaeon]|nr:hypothetical protein [Candidatus Woesearchaeota archaeon]